MALTPREVRTPAPDLLHPEQSGKPIGQRYPEATAEDAYRFQAGGVRLRVQAGDPVPGHETRLAGKAVQQQFGVHTPDFGQLCASTFYPGGAALSDAGLMAARAEPGASFVLARPLRGPRVTVDAVEPAAASR